MTTAGRMAPRVLVALLTTSMLFEAGAVAPASTFAAPSTQQATPAVAPPIGPPVPTELLEDRTATSQTFDNHDGTYTTEVSPNPIFYQPRGSTAWEPIVLAFAASSKPGEIAVSDRAAATVSLSKSDADGGYVKVTSAGYQVAFSLIGGKTDSGETELASVSPVTNGPVADYADVLPGVDLRLIAGADGVKSFLILKRQPDQGSFTFLVDAPGLTLQAEADGSVSFIDAKGESVGRIPHPYAVDSTPSDERGGGTFSDAVTLTTVDVDGQPAVTVSVDADYLAKATYPIYVDPSVNLDTNLYGDAFASAKYPTMNFADYVRPDSPFYHEHWLGMDPTNSTNVNEVYMKFDLAGIPNGTVDSATLVVLPYHQYYSPPTATTTWVNKVSAAWTETGLTWNNRPASTAVTSQALVENVPSAFSVTSTVQGWITTPTTNFGFKLHENGNNGTYWKRLISSEQGTSPPTLSVTYHKPLASPTKPIWTTSRALTWNYSDPIGHAQSHFQAQVSAVSNFSSILSDSGVVAGAATSWSIPGGVTLTSGSLYYWRVQVKDGTGWSDWASSYFLWDVGAPTGSISLNGGAASTDTSTVRIDNAGTDPNTSNVYANDGRSTTTFVAGCGSVVCGGAWGSPVLGTDKAQSAAVVESNSTAGTWHSLTIDAAATNRPTLAMDVMRDNTSSTYLGVVSDDNDGFRYELRAAGGSSTFTTLAWTATSTPGSYATQTVSLAFTVGVRYRLIISAADSTGASYNLWWYPAASVQPTTPTLTTLGVYLPKPRLHVYQYASSAAPGTVWLDNLKVTQTGATAPFGVGISGVRYSSDGGANWGNWLGYADSLSYTLPAGAGSKTVSAQFRDALGNVSSTVTDSITVAFGNFGRQPQHSFETWDLGAGDELAVNLATGNLVLSHPLVTLPYRGGSLPLSLTYNSLDAANIGMGPGFRLNLQRRLTINGDNTVTFTDVDGARSTFTSPVTVGSVTTYTRPAGLYATLVKDTSQGIEFTLTYRDQSRDKFDIVGSEGLLVRAEDRHAAGVTMAYSTGTDIATVTDDTGRQVTFTWNTGTSPHQLATVADWAWIDGSGVVQTTATGTHRTYRFFYDGSGSLIGWSDPLNTGGTCPTGGSHLTCLTYAGATLQFVTKTQTVETFSAGTLGSSTRPITTSVTYSGSRVAVVKDAQQYSLGSAGTSFVADFADRVIATRPTTTTTYGLNATAADAYARIANVWRRLDPLTEIEHRTTWDATFPTEPATVIDNATALQSTPTRTLTSTYVPGSLGNLQKLVEPLTASTNRWTEYLYNANNDVTQRTVSQDGSGSLRTITRFCYEATCSTSGVGPDLLKQIDNYVDGLNGTNDTDVVTDYLYDAYGQRTRTTRHNRDAGGAVLDDRVDGLTFDSAGNRTSDIVNYVDGLVTGGTYQSTVLADAPFMYLGLGEPSGTFADGSGNGNAGSAVGSGLSRAVPALVGSTGEGALTFTDATTYVTRSPVTGLPSAGVTAEAWFRATAFANWIDLASHNWGGSGGYGWDLFVDGSGLLTWGLWQSGSSAQQVTFPGLTTGTTYHAVGTYDGNMLRLYLNGSQVGSLAVGALTLNTSASVFTGKTDTAAGVTVDELALYPSSLAASRVQAHYSAGSGGVPMGDDITPNAATLARTDVTTSYTYDTAGNQVSAADPRRAIEVAKGTSLGPDDFITRWTYDASNQRLTETTPTTPGNATQRTASSIYDELSNLREATDFGGASAVTTATEYDRAGRATHTYQRPPGPTAQVTAELSYDGDGRVLTSKDERQYDDASLGYTAYAYDALGRQIAIAEAVGTASASENDSGYDALNRRTSYEVGVTAPASLLSLYGYDLGDRTTQTDDGFTCAQETFDYRDRAVSSITGLAGGTCASGSDQRTIAHTYDGLARLTRDEITAGAGSGDRTVDDTFDSAGNRLAASNRKGGVTSTTNFVMNSLDQPMAEIRPDGSTAKTTYDPAGNATDRCFWRANPVDICLSVGSTWTNPPTQVTTTTYDARNQRVRLLNGATNGLTTYDPDQNYQVNAIYLPTGTGREHQTLYAYDARHRLATIGFQACAVDANHACTDTPISTGSNSYAYDDADNRTQVVEANGAASSDRRYCYDPKSQLITRNTAAPCSPVSNDEAYAYDDTGNRTTATVAGVTTNFAYDATGRLCDVETAPTAANCSGGNVTYDSVGRTKTWNGWTFGYDGDSRLLTACKSGTCAAGYDKVEFTYDGEGHRTKIVATAAGGSVTTTEFRYQGDAVVEEKVNGTTTRTYVLDEAGTIVKLTVAAGQPDAGDYLVNWNGHGDALNLLRVNADGTTTLANSFTYSSWGLPTTTTHNGVGDLGFRFLYVGQFDVQWDNTFGLGLHYMHARHYAPALGRFIQPDPDGLEDSLYAYVGNNPVTETDAAGTCFILCQIIVGAVIGAVIDTATYLATTDSADWDLGDATAAAAEGAVIGGGTALGVGVVGRVATTAVRVVRAARPVAATLRTASRVGNAIRTTASRAIAPLRREITIAPRFRIALTRNQYGRWPHYHRVRLDARGNVLEGQGIKRHRPWDIRQTDTTFWDRF